MALGLSYSSGGNSGDIVPFVKYDARAGRFFRRDRSQDAGGTYVSDDVDITSQFKAVIDMENIEVGYLNFPVGQAPQSMLAPHGSPMPARPVGDGWKQGARIMLKLHASCGGDVRETSSSAAAFLKGLDDLHTEYEAGKKANPGKLPIVVLETTMPITSGSGAKKSTNYQPVFKISGWAPRPTDLIHVPKVSHQTELPPAVQYAASPPSTGSTPVGAPAKATPLPANNLVAADDDFG